MLNHVCLACLKNFSAFYMTLNLVRHQIWYVDVRFWGMTDFHEIQTSHMCIFMSINNATFEYLCIEKMLYTFRIACS